ATEDTENTEGKKRNSLPFFPLCSLCPLWLILLHITLMIVTIDGPAGAGKSSAARTLAERLGFAFLDTGAMYRAVTLAGLRRGTDLRDETALAELLTGLTLDLPPGRVLLNGEDVTGLIRTAEVTAASGAVASSPVVRRRLVELQRAVAVGRDLVT